MSYSLKVFSSLFLISCFILGKSSMAQELTRSSMSTSQEVALFAGGCFWCVEEIFADLPGVIEVIAGYTGGYTENPTYEQVSHEDTGHQEAVQVIFDPQHITYEQLLDIYWQNIDLFDEKGQFCDKGESYKAMIYYSNLIQKEKAEGSKEHQQKLFSQSIVTEIKAATSFYPAEKYHQDYAKKNPLRYKFYRFNCGRDQRLKEIARLREENNLR